MCVMVKSSARGGDGRAATAGASAVFAEAFKLNTAAGGAIYVISAVAAILFACFLTAQRLLAPPQADSVATASLLQLGAAAVALLAFVASAFVAANPLHFTWLAALVVSGATVAALAVYVLPPSSPLGDFQGSAMGFDSVLRDGIGSEVGAAVVLAVSAAAAAGMDYATGKMRADRTGALVSLTACSAVVSSGVFFVLSRLEQHFGKPAAVGGAIAIMATLVATSWVGERIANKIGDYRAADSWRVDESVNIAAEETKVIVSIAMVASVLLPLCLVFSLGTEEGSATATSDSYKTEVAVVSAAIAAFLPLVSFLASVGLLWSARSPGLYSFVATCILAAAVHAAGILVPWTAKIIWLAVLAALAMLANMVLNNEDGGERKLSVMLMLVAGVATSLMLGNTAIALLPVALVAVALFTTGRSIAPAAIVAGAVLWSLADGATTDEATVSPVDPAVLIGRTCTTLAAVSLVLTQLFYLAGAVLPTVLSGLSIFGVNQTRIARVFGAVVLVAMLSLQSRDLTRFIVGASTKTPVCATEAATRIDAATLAVTNKAAELGLTLGDQRDFNSPIRILWDFMTTLTINWADTANLKFIDPPIHAIGLRLQGANPAAVEAIADTMIDTLLGPACREKQVLEIDLATTTGTDAVAKTGVFLQAAKRNNKDELAVVILRGCYQFQANRHAMVFKDHIYMRSIPTDKGAGAFSTENSVNSHGVAFIFLGGNLPNGSECRLADTETVDSESGWDDNVIGRMRLRTRICPLV